MAELEHLPQRSAPAGSVLFDEGRRCSGMPFLEAGRVRVGKSFPNGRELLLYELEPGHTCVASIGCLFGDPVYHVRAVAQTDIRMRLVPPDEFHRLMEQAAFRSFVLHQFAARTADLMGLVDALFVLRVDQRLAARLLAHGEHCSLTHQQLADDLGSVREIVSRVLARFAAEGWVAVERGRIRLLDPAALQRFSSDRS